MITAADALRIGLSQAGRKYTRFIIVALLCFLSAAHSAYAQAPIADISSVFAQGRIVGNTYTNDYFGLTLTVTAAANFPKAGASVSSQGQRARLVTAQGNSQNWEERYEIAILADAISANPLIHSPEQYVRAVRHQFEKEGFITVQQESPTDISGVSFIRVVMKTADQQSHYQGMYTAFLNGYIFSIQAEAPSQERLKSLLNMVAFKSQGK